MNAIKFLAIASLFALGCAPAETEPTGMGGSTSATGSASGDAASTGTGGDGGGCSSEQKECGGECVGVDERHNGHYWDCDDSHANGCEVDAFEDVNNCGACGVKCDIVIDNSVTACKVGYCEFVECLPGYVDCDGTIVSGCEAHPIDDAKNCGSCGHACPGAPHAPPTCAASECVAMACEGGWYDCDGIASDGCEHNGACN
jgi:hypothetical protein